MLRFGYACLLAAALAALAAYAGDLSINAALGARMAFWSFLVLGIVTVVGEIIAAAFDGWEVLLEDRAPPTPPYVPPSHRSFDDLLNDVKTDDLRASTRR